MFLSFSGSMENHLGGRDGYSFPAADLNALQIGIPSMLVDQTSLRTPQGCASPQLITEFLRASRKVSDDNVRNRLGQAQCGEVVASVYNEWQKRDSLLTFCEKVSGGFASAQSESGESDFSRPISWLVEHSRDEIKFAPTPSDPRIDAYAARDESEKNVTMSSFDWIRTEQLAESIIRDSTLQQIRDRCGLNFPPPYTGPK